MQADPATREAAFKDLVDYPYDIAAAAKIIEEQGVKGQEIVITAAPVGNNFAVIAHATAAAAESIGLKAKINTVTPNAYTTLFSDPEARKGTDLYYINWYLSMGDPQEMFSVLCTGEFANYGSWSNSDFDKAANGGIQTMDRQERYTKSVEAQKILNAEVPC